MYFWDVRAAGEALRREAISDREKAGYLLATTLLQVIQSALIGVLVTWKIEVPGLIGCGAVLGVTIIGFRWLLRVNARHDGREFVSRYVVLGFPTTVRLTVAYWLFGLVFAVVMASQRWAAPASLFWKAYPILFFPLYSVGFFWQIGVGFRQLAKEPGQPPEQRTFGAGRWWRTARRPAGWLQRGSVVHRKLVSTVLVLHLFLMMLVVSFNLQSDFRKEGVMIVGILGSYVVLLLVYLRTRALYALVVLGVAVYFVLNVTVLSLLVSRSFSAPAEGSIVALSLVFLPGVYCSLAYLVFLLRDRKDGKGVV